MTTGVIFKSGRVRHRSPDRDYSCRVPNYTSITNASLIRVLSSVMLPSTLCNTLSPSHVPRAASVRILGADAVLVPRHSGRYVPSAAS